MWATRVGRGRRLLRKREQNNRYQSFAPIPEWIGNWLTKIRQTAAEVESVSRSEGTSHRIREKCSRGVLCTLATTKFSVNLLETPTGLDLSTISDTRSFFLRFIPPLPLLYPLRSPLSNQRPFHFSLSSLVRNTPRSDVLQGIRCRCPFR